jgi:potassium efflux system protein
MNWTFSNRQRAIEIPVNVAYSSDAARVVELLRRAAAEDPRVAKEPAPQALFLKFDADFVTFQLRVFTDKFSEWVQLRSDLGIKVQTLLREAGIKNK